MNIQIIYDFSVSFFSLSIKLSSLFMSRARVRSLRGTVRITPTPETPKETGMPVIPPSAPETLDSLLASIFENIPLNSDKCLALSLLLTTLIPYPLRPSESETLLRLLTTPPQTSFETSQLTTLLSTLVDKSKGLPPDQVELIVKFLPISIRPPKSEEEVSLETQEESRQFDLEKAYFLRLLLTRLEPYPLSSEEARKLLSLLRQGFTPSAQELFPLSSVETLSERQTVESPIRGLLSKSDSKTATELLRRLRDNAQSLPLPERELVRNSIPIPLIGPDEINQLKALSYPPPNNQPIVTLSDRSTLFEIVNLILFLGFDETLAFLKRVVTPANIIFDSPLMERAQNNYILNLENLKTKVRTAKGTVPCPRCRGTNVQMSERQVRSIDEPTTVYFKCIDCDKTWKI